MHPPRDLRAQSLPAAYFKATYAQATYTKATYTKATYHPRLLVSQLLGQLGKQQQPVIEPIIELLNPKTFIEPMGEHFLGHVATP